MTELKILLLETGSERARHCAQLLTEAGHIVYAASNLEMARALLMRRQFDVLVCNMGFDYRHGLREGGRPLFDERGTRLIITSGQERGQDIVNFVARAAAQLRNAQRAANSGAGD